MPTAKPVPAKCFDRVPIFSDSPQLIRPTHSRGICAPLALRYYVNWRMEKSTRIGDPVLAEKTKSAGRTDNVEFADTR